MDYTLNIDSHIGPWGYTRQLVAAELKPFKKKPVCVRISSPGGSLDDALDIRQQFLDHGDVTAYIYGYTASAATIIAMGAKKICMSKYAFFLVHKVMVWVDAWGRYNADQIENMLQDLQDKKVENDKMDLVVAALYAKKCGKPIEDVVEVMRKGQWLTAQEAKDFGFVDEIIEDGDIVNFDEYSQHYCMFELPTPVLPAKGSQPETTAAASPSWLNRLCHAIDRLTGYTDDMKQGADAEDPQENIPVTVHEMKKEFVYINSALQVEGVEEKDGQVVLSLEQVTALNTKLKKLENDLQAEKDNSGKLQQQVDNLKQADGDESQRVNGQEGSSDEDDISLVNSVFDNFKNLI